MRTTSLAAGATALVLAMTACGAPSEQSSGGGEGEDAPLRVGTMPVPHGDILSFIDENLAEEAGLELDIQEMSDYNTPNAGLVDGELDANYFQHREFLNEWQENGPDADLTYVTDVHIERLGLYSEGVQEIGDLDDGAEIAVPNDPANLSRALRILEEEGLVELDPDAGEDATENDIVENPQDLVVTPLEAPQIPRSLADVDAAVVNGNYAIEADLAEGANTLAWEPEGEDYVESYANGLVALEENTDDERVQKLAELMKDERVLEYIQDTWKGVVLGVDTDGEVAEVEGSEEGSEGESSEGEDSDSEE